MTCYIFRRAVQSSESLKQSCILYLEATLLLACYCKDPPCHSESSYFGRIPRALVSTSVLLWAPAAYCILFHVSVPFGTWAHLKSVQAMICACWNSWMITASGDIRVNITLPIASYVMSVHLSLSSQSPYVIYSVLSRVWEPGVFEFHFLKCFLFHVRFRCGGVPTRSSVYLRE